MKAKQQQRKTQPPAEVQMEDEAQPKARPKRAKKAAAKDSFAPSAKAAKFKHEQHLQIDTQDFAKAEEEKVAAPPSSANKKRRRRSAAEIDRKFTCQIGGCQKAYGTESSLTHHQKLKHPDKLAEETQENQVGAFLLPLHTASRNVTIRPATPLVTFASDPNVLLSGQSSEDLAEIAPPSAKAQRCNARFRSNSLPVAGSTDKTQVAPTCTPIKPKARAKTPRKPRRAPTPPSKKPASATKSRSKSESLTEKTPLQEFNPPHSSEIIHDPSSGGRPSFEWPPSSISASSDDQAIDSDILSVLANCDAEDLDFARSCPSYQSSANFGESEDAEMLPVGLECFKIAEHATLPTEPEAELGLNAFATLGDDWHLASHLEKMSVQSPAHHLESAFAASSQRPMGRLRSASDPSYAATPLGFDMVSPMPFSGQSDESTNRSGEPLEGALGGHPQGPFPSWGSDNPLEPAKMDASPPQQVFWLSGDATVATEVKAQPSSQALDELLERDDPLEWKTPNGFADIDDGLGDATITSALL